MSDWAWVGTVAIPLIVAVIGGLLGGGLITFLMQQRDAERLRRRDGYSAAIAALHAWHEYPYQIKRRSSDSRESLDRLVQLGHENQQRLARSLAWIAADDAGLFVQYQEAIALVKERVGTWTSDAWNLPHISSASEMNLNGWGPASIDDVTKPLLDAIADRVR